ncbi:hypothetical protein E8E13_007511 [Curvularia kusanoi]|uniref:Uncharacterized protein n=1 Tax=Curvularia kusanoi TaxID=90978 RepID=A0A9P4TMT7_CURKU|nr:hypothetical protein E8E13_007511 [Curvularia kusanoi]
MAAMQVEEAEVKKKIISISCRAKQALLDRRRRAAALEFGVLDPQSIHQSKVNVREDIQAMNALFRFADIPEIE